MSAARARSLHPMIPCVGTAGLKLEVEPNEGVKEVTYDEQEKVVRIPLSAMEGGRRTKLVMFTCNKCGKQATLHRHNYSAALEGPCSHMPYFVFHMHSPVSC